MMPDSHAPTIIRTMFGITTALAAVGAMVGVIALLLSKLPHLTPQAALIGATFGATFGIGYNTTQLVVRQVRPNIESGNETTPAFLIGMAGAAFLIKVIWGEPIMWMVLIAFWFTIGFASIAMLIHHEMTQ